MVIRGGECGWHGNMSPTEKMVDQCQFCDAKVIDRGHFGFNSNKVNYVTRFKKCDYKL